MLPSSCFQTFQPRRSSSRKYEIAGSRVHPREARRQLPGNQRSTVECPVVKSPPAGVFVWFERGDGFVTVRTTKGNHHAWPKTSADVASRVERQPVKASAPRVRADVSGDRR